MKRRVSLGILHEIESLQHSGDLIGLARHPNIRLRPDLVSLLETCDDVSVREALSQNFARSSNL